MSRYHIQQFEQKYLYLELIDTESGSRALLCPERGGILTSLQLKGNELFYLDQATVDDPNANIRGGNPVLFPICGQLEGKSYTWEGKPYTMSNHGVARTNAWEVVGTSTDGAASVTLRLASNAGTLAMFPFPFELRFTYTLQDGKLTLRQEYYNHSDSPMPMYAGFHPYFATESKAIAYETDATEYLDYNDHIRKPLQNNTIDLAGLVESVTLLDTKQLSITFPLSGGFSVRLSYSDAFKYVVLWSQEGKPFVCVEPWMAMNDELNRGDELVLVEPQGVFKAELAFELA